MEPVYIYGYSVYILQWLFPITMIFFYDLKTSKFNKMYMSLYILTYTLLCSYFIYSYILGKETILFYFFRTFPTTYLMFFYGIIASTFVLFLIASKKWDFPQAFATSIFCISIGSFLWESPIIIYNLLTVGFEIDILLYLVCLLYVFFLYTKGIWKTDKNAKLALLLSIIISTILLIFRSPIPTDRHLLSPYWNSPYFMTNRFISTAIVLYCVNTNKPMEKSNKK